MYSSFQISEPHSEFVHKFLLSLPVKTNLDVSLMDVKLPRLGADVVTLVLCDSSSHP